MPTTTLQERIIERIQREGPLTFAEYMRMALYEPNYGYYVTDAAKMGLEGPITTPAAMSLPSSPTAWAGNCGTCGNNWASQHLLRCWSRARAVETWRKAYAPGPNAKPPTCTPPSITTPKISTQVRMRSMPLQPDPHTGHPTRYPHIPRPTPQGDRKGRPYHDTRRAACAAESWYGRPLRSPWGAGRWRRSPWGGGGWRRSPGERGDSDGRSEAGDVEGVDNGYHVILSNELVDAFPVQRVMVYEGQLYEIYVDVKDGRLYEVLDEPSTPQVADYLDHYKIPWRTFGDGWQAEINLDALRWMQSTAGRLHKTPRATRGRGFLLVIDYGDKARALYTKNRRSGTLASYFRHQFTERPLVRPGEQDITAHVNFSALIEEGRRQGLRLHSFTTQREWLARVGIHEELDYLRKTEYAAMDTERASDRGQTALFKWRNLHNQVAALTDPTGMGNFKVLIMRR